MSSFEEASRVNAAGQAYKGSQKHIQAYVNEHEALLSGMVLEKLQSSPGIGAGLTWVSPLKCETYKEYSDQEFLYKLDLGMHAGALKEFWPKGGPSWDALAKVTGPRTSGVVLVEAKSHVAELASSCGAADPASRARIEASLACTKRRLGVAPEYDWMGSFYQSANRYAHLLFLRDLGVQAWLVNIYFVNDHPMNGPATKQDWENALSDVKRQMGLSGKSVPYATDLFIELNPHE
ncbi:MAG: hypothetical protein EPN47_12655 [Acidobacteria bacterium]|nr:MAG: hypothetical protein EPN47_12655 [Acidobacteriota bacterium]